MIVLLHYAISISLFTTMLMLCKRPNQLSDKIFVVFLISMFYPMVFVVFNYESMLIDRLSKSMPLTLGPFMLIYTESLISNRFRLNRKTLIHFSPCVIYFLIVVLLPEQVFFSPVGPQYQSAKLLEICYVILLMFSFLSYSIWIHNRLKNHRKNVLDYFTQTPNRITLVWLTWVVTVFFNIFILVHIPRTFQFLNLLPKTDFYPNSISAENIHHIGFILFIVVLSFFGVRQSQVFKDSLEATDEEKVEGKGPKTNEGSSNNVEEVNDKTSVLREEQLENYLIPLESHMQSEKPYLDCNLTSAKLAKMLNMPKHHLTEVINRKEGKNFFNYVNDYRISEIKQLFQDPENNNKTILTLAFQVGFNSKTTFNTFFKKSTQMTPTQFRKMR